MDVLRALSTPNHDVRMKTIDIALELITPKNIDQVVMMVVQAIHTCAIKFPEVAIALLLLDTFYQIRAVKCLGDLPFYTIYEDGEGQETSKAVQQV
ncbi:coatomer subunit beta-1-like, partial [Trifolium medium]|nr:coatomer subunit beta-1-like [Trifolium medium]